MKSPRHIPLVRPVAFAALVVATVLALTGIAQAATDPTVDPPPNIQPDNGAMQDYCDDNHPGTTGIVFSTDSATNFEGTLTRTEAGYTLTWDESTDPAEDHDIAVLSITEDSDTVPLVFSIVVAFLPGDATDGYEYDPPATADELNLVGSNGRNITHFGFCAITTGEIVVGTVTDPGPATDNFDFTASWDADGFSLTDRESINSGRLDAGIYSVAETVPDGWDLTSSTCDDGSDPSAISLSAGETVTCTFRNQADANIIVRQQTDPAGSDQEFTFTTTYSARFALTDGETNDSGDIDPGIYSVAETVPDRWEQTGATCDDGSDPSAISLSAGETVTCTFRNEADANIIVRQQTDPADSDDLFSFSTNYSGRFQLSDGLFNDSGDLDPGIYSVVETVPDGWKLDSVECNDGSEPAAIELVAGETVICTFANQADANIIVENRTEPDGSTQPFTFSSSFGADFQLSDGQIIDSGDLDPGTYSATESVPDGWDLASAVCDDGSEPDAIDLVGGETVTCVFTNTERGSVELLSLDNGLAETWIDWNFTLSGPEVATRAATPPALLDFGGARLIPRKTYTVCAAADRAGRAMEWTVGGVALTPYDPNAGVPAAPTDTRCVDISVEPGQTLGIEVDGVPPPFGGPRRRSP